MYGLEANVDDAGGRTPLGLAVRGTGRVGLVTGACLAHAGHRLTCLDVDEEKVRALQAGRVPI